MFRKYSVLALALVAGILAACGGRGSTTPGMGGASFALPPVDDLSISASLPKHEIGEDLPSVLGTVKASGWGNEMLGGFTQTQWSQRLAFPPGTKLTIRNLSKTGTSHTFNVVKVESGNAVKFPSNPSLSTRASGHGKLEAGYASGIIAPGKSVTVTLVKEGTYLVGCAFHYASNGMRDILVVKAGAKPGPQATPPAAGGSPSPSPTGSGGGGGWQRP
ncbi:MAG: hypothetical protein JO029_07420 [Candidatus Eremiobacteraeota bacterium]|nr:hypothetical protein [Candidatus Eremiobacteraeota bacterium]MBV8283793.1 hypothetical protein [Candidatus Eremiobacteraeota bacterium]MBV8434089.1 hypothetical protein [Candidatus Eremiobacteraeota bacterium]MBV8583902.1 hypothetical protein [Candidatus Eremiobacteraeota bacterium]MBV8655129.1 hypothetical protein [Candidatus Eremiobacteraeota bacterium]